MKKQPIGHRSTVYGDEGTPLIAVYELDFDEQVAHDLVKTTKEKLKQFEYGAKLTPTQKGQKAELEAVLEEVVGSCKHRVFRDEDGFIYYPRYCCTCGAFMGSV